MAQYRRGDRAAVAETVTTNDTGKLSTCELLIALVLVSPLLLALALIWDSMMG